MAPGVDGLLAWLFEGECRLAASLLNIADTRLSGMAPRCVEGPGAS